MNNFNNNFKNNFTQVPNEVLNDKELSLKSKGLLVYLISKKDDWNFSAKGIASQNKEGLTSINNGLKELELLKYLKRTKIKNDDGKFSGIVYTIQNRFEIPSEDTKTETTLTDYTKPINGETENGKPTNISNTITSNTILSNNEESNTLETKVSLENQSDIVLVSEKEKKETPAQKTIREKREFIEALEMNGAFKDYAEEYVDYRCKNKLSLSKIVLNKFLKESQGLNLNEVIEFTMDRNWKSFKREWYNNANNKQNNYNNGTESKSVEKIGRLTIEQIQNAGAGIDFTQWNDI